jgi:hypothetical protein
MNFFFQGSWGHGAHKNFEVVVPHGASGLAHYWRDNGVPGAPWHGPVLFGSGDVEGVAAIESSFGPRNFEVVAVRDGRLDFYWRQGSPSGLQWRGPVPIPLPDGMQVRGGPSLLQLSYGPHEHRDFVLEVPGAQGHIILLRRDNTTGVWSAPALLGRPRKAYGVSVVQYLGGVVNYFVTASSDGQMVMDSHIAGGLAPIEGSVVIGTPGMVQTSYGAPEVVVPEAKQGLVHFFRQNGSDGPWRSHRFGSGDYVAASLIQSDFTDGPRDGQLHGNLEVVAVPHDRRGFHFYWRSSATFAWHGPQVIV